MELKICMFLSTLFWNEDFISQESPILADVENKVFYWIRKLWSIKKDPKYDTTNLDLIFCYYRLPQCRIVYLHTLSQHSIHIHI